MAEAVKQTRRYHSPRRQAQAAATRLAILEAAGHRFVADGYPATTMEAIAAQAAVALKTVYLAFGTKGGVLRSVWDLRLKGDEDEVAVAERPWYREVLDEPDPEQQLRLNARNGRAVKERIAPMLRVIRDAAPTDDDTAELWALIQSDFYENQRVVVASLKAKKALRPGLGVKRGTDILWALNHPDTWFLLVGQRGWTPAGYERWLAETSVAQLLIRRRVD